MHEQVRPGLDLGPLRRRHGEDGRRLDDDGGAAQEPPRPVVDGAHVAAAVSLLGGPYINDVQTSGQRGGLVRYWARIL